MNDIEKLSEHDKYVLTNRMLVNELCGPMPQEQADKIELESDYYMIDRFNRMGFGYCKQWDWIHSTDYLHNTDY